MHFHHQNVTINIDAGVNKWHTNLSKITKQNFLTCNKTGFFS